MSSKRTHEFRDPIHTFIRMSTGERKIVDTPPFQRLRHIHQLATTFLVYPGATHRRFEHSLGVMELAARVFDVMMNRDNIREEIEYLRLDDYEREYWCRALRLAALLHDVGHLPFSHAGERELLPEGWDHERLTYEMICSDDLSAILADLKVDPQDVSKLAVGPEKYKKYTGELFSDWEAIVSEIITGDAFGVDRMDYLLRDSHHAGVAYGRFDHHRLIDCLRILPFGEEGSREPTLGVDHGGLHSAEALLLARYFMFTQLYFHPVRRIYDIHLMDFLKEWLPAGVFETNLESHLSLTDNDVMSAILKAARNPESKGHEPARRIARRDHFRLLYKRNPDDVEINPESVRAVYKAACGVFGESNLRCDIISAKAKQHDFPVLEHDGRIVSSLAISDTLKVLPPVSEGYVFINPELRDQAQRWLQDNRGRVLEESLEGERNNDEAATAG